MIDPSCSAAIVTAAGFSSRMGSLKPLLDWHGTPLIQHQVDRLAHWGQVIVVLGHEAERIRRQVRPRPGLRFVVHPGHAEGRASSLRAGFETIQGNPEAVLVVGVDQPIDAISLDLLTAAMRSDTAIALPVSATRRGHPVLFSGRLLGELKLIREEDQGLRAVVRRHPVLHVRVPGPLWNLNHPEAYALARMGQLEATFSRLEEYPVHSTRRSREVFARNLRAALAPHPDCYIAGHELFLAAVRMEAQGNAWIHVGARSYEVLNRELPGAWSRLSEALEGYKAEAWLADERQVEAFERLGFRLARRMVRYRLEALEAYPPHPGIRAYREEDFPAIMALHRLTTPEEEQLSEAGYRDVMRTYHRTAVLEAEGRILGYSHFRVAGDLGLLEGLAVHPDAQGRGYGRAILSEALSRLLEAGVQRVELLALSEAVAARALYERVGFRPIAEQYWVEAPVRAAMRSS